VAPDAAPKGVTAVKGKGGEMGGVEIRRIRRDTIKGEGHRIEKQKKKEKLARKTES